MKQKFYAYLIPKTGEAGVSDSWTSVERKVKGVQGSRYKGFTSRHEAEGWLAGGADYGPSKPKTKNLKLKTLESGIYFDAGTGRGKGVEVSVTDEAGGNLLHKVLSKKDLNKFGKHLVGKNATNNYGELLGCLYALEIAIKDGVKKVFGDSKLVIDYWSKGFIKKKDVAEETVELALAVTGLREEFEEQGGSVGRVSGDVNPADLGFHK